MRNIAPQVHPLSRPVLTQKYKTRPKRLARDQRSSLLGHFFSDKEKSFYNLASGVYVMKLFIFIIHNKPEFLTPPPPRQDFTGLCHI
jgi:hypothetical protein